MTDKQIDRRTNKQIDRLKIGQMCRPTKKPDRQTYASDRQVDIYLNKERQRDR
jgi:hypothetical protein